MSKVNIFKCDACQQEIRPNARISDRIASASKMVFLIENPGKVMDSGTYLSQEDLCSACATEINLVMHEVRQRLYRTEKVIVPDPIIKPEELPIEQIITPSTYTKVIDDES